MSLTYTAESYESGPLSTTTEYKLSDGSRWVRIVEEYIAPDMKSRRRTRVLRSDFPGDKEHRDTLTNLQGAIANADLIMQVEPSSAPVKLDTAAVTGSTEEPALDLRRYLPGELVHNGTSPVVYTVVRHRKDGKINLTSPSGRSITLPDDEISPAVPASRDEKREAAIAAAKAEDAARVSNPGPEDAPNDEVLDVQFLGINANQSMSWSVTFMDGIILTGRGETREEAIAEAKTFREAQGFNQPMLPAFVIEPGFEEQAHPMSRRQEAVLLGISAELELTSSMDVVPPLERFGDVVASLGEEGSRVAVEVGCEGFLSDVRVRFTLGGESEWVSLTPDSGSKLYSRLMDAARGARRSVKPDDAGLLGE